MITRIRLAVILCLIPAQTDTGPGRDVASIHHLIEQYAKAVDLNLANAIVGAQPLKR
jgi:hypothetical protein